MNKKEIKEKALELQQRLKKQKREIAEVNAQFRRNHIDTEALRILKVLELRRKGIQI